MRTNMGRTLVALTLVVLVGMGVSAQEVAPPPIAPPTVTPTDPNAPRPVELVASDGLTLRGAYFAPHANAPAVLLLHQLYTTRHSWDSLTLAFNSAGYNVLAVDLRGYGQTRGAINWTQAQDDTTRWAAWLSQQPGVQSVALVGSSMGSSLAINGCAAFDPCRGAVAISPGLTYFGVSVEAALGDSIKVLAVYADHDRYPAEDMPTLQELAGDRMTVITLSGRGHGVGLFREDTTLIPSIVEWVAAL